MQNVYNKKCVLNESNRKRSSYYRPWASWQGTFWTLTEWEWSNGYNLEHIKTFQDVLYLGVL